MGRGHAPIGFVEQTQPVDVALWSRNARPGCSARPAWPRARVIPFGRFASLRNIFFALVRIAIVGLDEACWPWSQAASCPLFDPGARSRVHARFRSNFSIPFFSPSSNRSSARKRRSGANLSYNAMAPDFTAAGTSCCDRIAAIKLVDPHSAPASGITYNGSPVFPDSGGHPPTSGHGDECTLKGSGIVHACLAT